MNTKCFLVLFVALMGATVVSGHDYQCYSNDIGDSKILTMGGYTFAEPIAIELSPANAPDAMARYSLRCRVAYKDNLMPHPMTDAEFELVLKIAGVINSWLKDFIDGVYGGIEYAELLKSYKSGKFRKDIKERFPGYVAEQISAMDPSGRPDIETVTVEIESEGLFKEELIKELEKESQGQDD